MKIWQIGVTAFIAILISIGFYACDENDNIVLFSIEDDKDLGQQVSEEIANDSTLKVLADTTYVDAYQYLRNMRDEILNSGEVVYKEEFVWKVHIIENDTVLNAFATPGGYIYVYTGLIKFLDNADDLAGVLGHEIAHSDLRHTSRNLQKQYGVSILLGIILGEDPNTLAAIAGQITGALAGLKFSREFEKEADNRSVEYLARTQYACNGAGNFFTKMSNTSSGSPPEFLSTHPTSESRVEAINQKADEAGCDTSLATNTNYDEFIDSLP